MFRPIPRCSVFPGFCICHCSLNLRFLTPSFSESKIDKEDVNIITDEFIPETTPFSESMIEIEDANVITDESIPEMDKSMPEKEDSDPPTPTCQYIMETEEPSQDERASLSGTRPTRYMMEIDDCLPEYCMNCPLWKPFSPQNFCWLKFRCKVRVLVEKKYFEWFILASVFLSSFALVSCKILPFRKLSQLRKDVALLCEKNQH